MTHPLPPLFDLTGQVAVITGSSRGIGRAIALRMAEAGARVVISSRKADACAAVVTEIDERFGPGRAIALPANISDKDSLAAMVSDTMDHWGRIDVLVCNAASNPYYGPMLNIEDGALRKVLDNNIVSTHWLIALTAPQMCERRDGAIIIVSSIGGIKGSAVMGAYNISKAADMQLARNMAVELGPHNIRVNTIAPGLIQTDFARALWDDPANRAHYQNAAPLGRIGAADDIAGTALYLATRAGAFVTGQTIVVDGGTTITGV